MNLLRKGLIACALAVGAPMAAAATPAHADPVIRSWYRETCRPAADPDFVIMTARVTARVRRPVGFTKNHRFRVFQMARFSTLDWEPNKKTKRRITRLPFHRRELPLTVTTEVSWRVPRHEAQLGYNVSYQTAVQVWLPRGHHDHYWYTLGSSNSYPLHSC